jgi:hypothetical protein
VYIDVIDIKKNLFLKIFEFEDLRRGWTHLRFVKMHEGYEKNAFEKSFASFKDHERYQARGGPLRVQQTKIATNGNWHAHGKNKLVEIQLYV